MHDIHITSLGSQIYLLDAHYIRDEIAAIYLMVHEDRVAIIETGTSRSSPSVVNGITELGYSTDHVDYVIPTHVHLDHAGGAGELMSLCPNAKLVVHPYGARHMINPEKLVAGTSAVYGEEKFRRLYGEVKPVDSSRVIEAPDLFELDFAGRKLQFLDTPGHARHHFCIYDETSDGIFTGDSFGLCYPQLNTAEGPFMLATTTPVQFDPAAMHSSLDRLLALQPTRAYLTHFGAVEITDKLVKQLRASIDEFTDIALKEKNHPEDRVSRMAANMMQQLLARLKAMHCFREEKECRELLLNDVNLNVQGLEVWLQRQTS